MRTVEDTMEYTAKTKPKFKDLMERNWGRVRTLGMSDPDVLIRWKKNEKFTKHKLVEIHVGDQQFTVAVEELEQYLRMA